MDETQLSFEKMAQLNVRIPQNLKKLMKEYVELDAHKDLSELTRDAIREKIQKDAPHLYQNLFNKEQKNEESLRIFAKNFITTGKLTDLSQCLTSNC
jgi:Arc/MetJ-type ribon-helix-helix transcriptional regulator